MLEQAIQQLAAGRNLDTETTYNAVQQIMEGRAGVAQIAAFLMGLRVKGETAEEITGGARCMTEQCVRIHPRVPFSVDPVGTGGDKTGMVNVSSMAAIVASAAGAAVAKHGNRSVSSSCGSADLYEALGIEINLQPADVQSCIEDLGFGFMFAPVFHPAMRHAAPVRRELGLRTLFNILGPLSNPARADGQLLGVYTAALMPVMTRVLINLGVRRAMVVHGADGSDEITLTGTTLVTEIRDGKTREYQIEPEQFGLRRCALHELKGGQPDINAQITHDMLAGKPGPIQDVTLLNAAATLYVGKAADSIEEGLHMARRALLSGDAGAHLETIVRRTQQLRQQAEGENIAI